MSTYTHRQTVRQTSFLLTLIIIEQERANQARGSVAVDAKALAALRLLSAPANKA